MRSAKTGVPDTLELGLGGTGWFFFALFLVISTAFFIGAFTTRGEDRKSLFVLGSIFLLLAIGAVFGEIISRGKMDTQGIRWQTLRGKREALWEDVTDYYLAYPSQDTCLVIVTAAGTLRIARKWYNSTCFRLIQEAVIQRATNARAREWELQGVRPWDTWPRIFRYASPAIIFTTVLESVLYSVGLMHPLFLWGWANRTYGILGMQTVICMFTLAELILFPLALYSFLRQLSALRHRWRHRKEVWELTPESLRFSHDGTYRDIAWSEVSDYLGRPGKDGITEFVLTLRGVGEKEFVFTGLIQNVSLMAHLIPRYAPKPVSVTVSGGLWPAGRKDADCGESTALATMRAVRAGARVYSYRTESNRKRLAGIILSFFIVCAAPLVIQWLERDRHPISIVGSSLFIAVFLLSCLALARCYYHCRIELDDFCLTRYNFLGQRQIYWIAVTDYKFSSAEVKVQGKDGTNIAFSNYIDGFHELMAEIERRDPASLASVNQL